MESDYNPSAIGLKYIDHMVGNVGWGEMDTWVKWYEDVMDLKIFFHLMISKFTWNTCANNE